MPRKKAAPNAQVPAASEPGTKDKGGFYSDFLQTLSNDALLKLAEDMDVPIPDPENREALISLIAGEELTAPSSDDRGIRESQDPDAQIPPTEPKPEQSMPYKAVVLPALLVARKEPDGPVVGTLSRGDEVTVTGRRDGYAQMDNGLYIRENHVQRL